MNSNENRTNRWVGIALLGFSGLWIWVVLATIPGPASPEEPGPRMFPLILGSLLALLALFVLAGSFKKNAERAAAQESGQPPSKGGLSGDQRQEVMVVLTTFLLLVAYGFLMEQIGFILATPLVLVLIMVFLLGQRNWRKLLAIPIGFTLGCHLIFNVLLEANLPRGNWIRLF